MSQSFESYFKSIAGSWLLEREISTGETFHGKAVFEHISKSAFLMREEGQLVLSDKKEISASRNWYWHLSDENTLEITYDEAALQNYHLLSLDKFKAGWCGTAKHLCGSDLYSGDYKFYEKRLEITQTIKGPKKSYVVSSIYSK